MKVLVTGSAGHLGEALVRTLQDLQHEVIGIDIRASPFTSEVCSILDRACLRGCISGADAVFIYLRSGLGWTALASGVGIMPFAAGFFVGTLRSARLYERIGNHILSVGFGLLAFGFAVTALVLHAGFRPGIIFYVGLICAGVGQGFLQPSTVRIVLTEVEPEKAGLAAGVITSTLQVGAAVGVAAVGSVFFSVLGKQTTAIAYSEAFASALAVAACVQAIGIFLAAVLNRRRPLEVIGRKINRRGEAELSDYLGPTTLPNNSCSRCEHDRTQRNRRG